ncbi:MAG: deazaflavin-dependent oxidoreductase (nitroreductase family) [Bacteroidia bacterium]
MKKGCEEEPTGVAAVCQYFYHYFSTHEVAPMTDEIKPFTAGQEKFGSWIINRVGRWQTVVYELTGGRLWNTFLGGPVAILSVVGRKSGVLRKIPLLFLKDGDNVVMTASKGGMSKLPIWYHNVVAATTVDIQIRADKNTYTMREATPEEETVLWPQLEVMYPDYKEYRARTEGVRRIPVLIFEPTV